MIAKDFAASVLLGALTGQTVVRPTSGLVTEVALVDGTTGDVLWTNIGFADAIPRASRRCSRRFRSRARGAP